MQLNRRKASKIKGFKGFAKNDFWVRLPSSPLKNPVKSRVCGLACYLGNRQVTTYAKGEAFEWCFSCKNNINLIDEN